MRTSRVRAVAVSILSPACAALAFLTAGTASASASVSVPTAPLLTWSQP
jgi:hypothetical protein